MKLIYTFWILIILSLTTYGQNVGIGTSSPNAILDVSATNGGILIPRVALTGTGSVSPLTSPATSTMVYNTATAGSGATTVTPGYYYWSGTAWIRLIDNASIGGATTVSNTSSANTLSTTVNGVTGTGVNIITGNTLNLTGNTLTSTVNGIAPTQSLSGLSLSGDVTGTLAADKVVQIQGQPVSATAPTAGQVLEYIGSTWTPTSPTLGTVTSIGTTAPITGGTITGSGTIGISQGTTSTNGYLSSTDWNTFNNKQGTVSLTTTGNSGAATFSSNTLNIPNYTLSGLGGQAALTAGNGITISSNIVSDNLWTASSTNIYNANSGNVGIGTTSPLAQLSIGAGSLSDANLPVQMSTGGTGTQAWYAVNKNGAYGLLMGYSNGPLGTQAIIRNVTTDPLAFYVNNTTQAVTILSSGNVGIGTSSPGSTLQLNGSFGVTYANKTANYTVGASDYYVQYTSTTAAGTFTLPAGGAAIAGRMYVLKNSSTSTFILTIQPATGELIEGAGSVTINPGGSGTIIATGLSGSGNTTWNVVSAYSPHGSRLFTSSGTFTPALGVTMVYITAAGGGGGGGSACTSNSYAAGGGGGAAATNSMQFVITANTAIAVTVGTGGAAGLTDYSPENASAGGTTSFGSYISLAGGGGGGGSIQVSGSGAGGIGGTGGVGVIAGSNGTVYSGSTAGAGGGSLWGTGGAIPGGAGVGYGGGGGGGSIYAAGHCWGAAGSPGAVVVVW